LKLVDRSSLSFGGLQYSHIPRGQREAAVARVVSAVCGNVSSVILDNLEIAGLIQFSDSAQTKLCHTQSIFLPNNATIPTSSTAATPLSSTFKTTTAKKIKTTTTKTHGNATTTAVELDGIFLTFSQVRDGQGCKSSILNILPFPPYRSSSLVIAALMVWPYHRKSLIFYHIRK